MMPCIIVHDFWTIEYLLTSDIILESKLGLNISRNWLNMIKSPKPPTPSYFIMIELTFAMKVNLDTAYCLVHRVLKWSKFYKNNFSMVYSLISESVSDMKNKSNKKLWSNYMNIVEVLYMETLYWAWQQIIKYKTKLLMIM